MGRNLYQNPRGGKLIDLTLVESRVHGVSSQWISDVKAGEKGESVGFFSALLSSDYHSVLLILITIDRKYHH